MATNVTYTTGENDRWDSIAYKAYGNAGMAKLIIEANPDVSITAVLPAGITLNIPVIEEEEIQVDQSELPPWKRD